MNSIWGMIYQIMEKLNMSYYEIMWKRSWINIEMMLADAPKMVKKSTIVNQVTGAEMAARHRQRKNG